MTTKLKQAVIVMLSMSCYITAAEKPEFEQEYTPLLQAVIADDCALVRRLLDKGQDQSITNTIPGGIVTYPLLEAVKKRSVCMVDVLLGDARSQRVITTAGLLPRFGIQSVAYTPLAFAVNNNDADIVERILNAMKRYAVNADFVYTLIPYAKTNIIRTCLWIIR